MFPKMNLYSRILMIAMVVILSACTVKEKEGERPNIIFLMDDQHRWDALGVINKEVITPNIDKLAKEGVHFTQAVCQAPMCVPSRNSMMLGLYPNQIGILRNEPGIPDDKLKEIFYPMVTTKNDGMGLGLTIAQSIIIENNGIIECKSKNKETIFSIILPWSTK